MLAEPVTLKTNPTPLAAREGVTAGAARLAVAPL